MSALGVIFALVVLGEWFTRPDSGLGIGLDWGPTSCATARSVGAADRSHPRPRPPWSPHPM
jgi:hypothetical protein